MNKNIFITALCFSVTLLSGCSQDNQKAAAKNGLTILAGSEIKAIEPILKEAENKLGFPIDVKYVGTIEGVDSIKSGENYSVAWFGNAKYFYDDPDGAKRIKLSEKIMFSPVIIGMKEKVAKEHNIVANTNYNWKDVASWVKDKNITYAMTDPSVSNTGYVALMGISYASANKGENLTIKDINAPLLKEFFKGQKVTAKSSNWLMDNFQADPNIGFIVNYESSILTYNSQNPNNQLLPIYPVEGIVTSDYPIMLLDANKTEQYKKLVDFLKSKQVQESLVKNYKYHSVLPEVMEQQTVFNNDQLLVEMPFTPDAQLADAILTAYFNDYKKPAKFVFVVDTSGSMSGVREEKLKETINLLASGKLSKFASIRNRETVAIIPFASEPYDMKRFDNKTQHQMAQYVNSLRMDGGTAMYDSVELAMKKLQEEMKISGKDYNYSVIVLTDGNTNSGHNYNEFEQWYKSQKINKGDIRVFAINFGDADSEEIIKMTTLTGGNFFDGKKSLSSTFRDIRSYQ
jgi:Ca-activated chloride channel family protein